MTGAMVQRAVVTPRDNDAAPGETVFDRFRNGDTRVFTELVYDGYKRSVYATMVRMRLPDMDRADVTQEVFAKIYAKRATFRGNSKGELTVFVQQVAVRIAIDAWRKRRRRSPQVSLDELGEAAIADPGSGPDQERVLAEAFIANLSEELRTLLEQIYVHGASEREAAKASGKTRYRVNELMKELRKKARTFMSNDRKRP